MLNVRCKFCNKFFYAKPSWIKYGNAKFCSKQCQYEGAKTGKWTTCFTCQKDIYRTVKALRVSKSKKYFCNKICQTIWRNQEFRGPRHANWKGGAHIEYREIMRKHGSKPFCKRCRNKDERVLCVHHRDKNRKNNDISNLMWLCHNCHHLIHNHKVKVLW